MKRSLWAFLLIAPLIFAQATHSIAPDGTDQPRTTRWMGNSIDKSIASKSVDGLAKEDLLRFRKNEGLISYYAFNRNTKDKSKNKNHGVLTGSEFTDDAIKGKAISLNGNGDEVRIPNQPSLNPTSELTVSAWIKVEDVGTNNGIILLKGSPPGQKAAQYALVFIHDPSRGNQNKVSFSLSTSVGSWNDYVSDATLDFDKWYHVVGTYKSGELNLYVDGEPARTTDTSVTGEITTQAGDLFIGSEHSFGDEYFRGVIDEVRIYNRALTPVEVQMLHTLDSPTSQTQRTWAMMTCRSGKYLSSFRHFFARIATPPFNPLGR